MRANNKIVEFNFIKAVSVIGIVAFHFAVETGRLDMLPGKYPLGGGVFVTIFFMVSGALLYYNYNEPENIKLFYYKRWKSVMPAFYVAFGCLYLLQVVQNRSFFYNGRPASLLLTLIGFDGYLNDIIPNYYLLGEWFLGAIIILYVVYPLLARVINKMEILAVLIITAAYVASLFSDIPYINGFKSIFSCLLSFTFGITIEKHKAYNNRWLAVPALAAFIAGNFLIAEGEINISAHAGGFFLFFVLFTVGGFIYRSRLLGKACDFLNRISYEIFLIHHVIIMWVLKITAPSDNKVMYMIYLLADIVLIAAAADVFSRIMGWLLKRKLFLKLENSVLTKINTGS